MKLKKSQEKFPQFKNKKILIMGLGLHGGGAGAAEFFAKAGAKVAVTDLRNKQQLKESIQKLKKFKIKYILGKHREKDFKNADLIIRNPAVPDNSPYLKIAKEHNVPIDTDIGIFFALLSSSKTVFERSTNLPQIVGITGTRGKSTTSTLIYKFLQEHIPFVIPAKAGIQANNQKINNIVLAGNIRKSVLLELPRITENTILILELSSWQLEGLAKHKKSPHIAAITNIMPDHLNRYRGMQGYITAKKNIFKFQTKNDFLFLNAEDKIVKGFAQQTKSKVIFFRTKEAKKFKTNLPGKHNLSNIAAAIKIAKHFGVGDSVIKKVLNNFNGLEGRIQKIAEINGVKYINDTTATTPDATIAAINTITENYKLKTDKLILIAGGADKNLDFSALTKLIVKKVSFLILLEGTATARLEQKIKKELLRTNKKLEIRKYDNIEKATETAKGISKAGDTVLLSPACASFGMFRHEFERGEKFKHAILALKSSLHAKNFALKSRRAER